MLEAVADIKLWKEFGYSSGRLLATQGQLQGAVLGCGSHPPSNVFCILVANRYSGVAGTAAAPTPMGGTGLPGNVIVLTKAGGSLKGTAGADAVVVATSTTSHVPLVHVFVNIEGPSAGEDLAVLRCDSQQPQRLNALLTRYSWVYVRVPRSHQVQEPSKVMCRGR